MWQSTFLVLVSLGAYCATAFELTGSQGKAVLTVGGYLQCDVPALTTATGTAVLSASAIAVTPASDVATYPFATTDATLTGAKGVKAIGVSLSVVPATDSVFATTAAAKASTEITLQVVATSASHDAQYGTKCVFAGTSDTATWFTIEISADDTTYYAFEQIDHTTGAFYKAFDCPFRYMRFATSLSQALAVGSARFFSA